MAAKKQKPVELTPVQKMHARRQELKDAGVEVTRKNPLERYQAKPTSRSLALKAKCYDCVGGEGSDGYRKTIGECPVAKCALHRFRPYQKDDADGEDDVE